MRQEQTVVQASAGLLEIRVLKADEDLLEKREHLEHQESQEPQEHPELQVLRGLEACGASQGPEDPLVYLELREDQERPEVQVSAGDEEQMDRRASLESQVSRVVPDPRAPEGPRVWTAETDMAPRDPEVPRETRASPDIPVSWGRTVFKDLKASQDQKATAAEGEILEFLAELEVQETQDTLDTRVLGVRPESA